MFGRAPSFFDEVCYTGTGSANQRITHNLGVVPELIIARLESLVDFMHKEASHGNAIYKSNIQSGHDLLYKADIIYIKKYIFIKMRDLISISYL
jgi:hypothetical protein